VLWVLPLLTVTLPCAVSAFGQSRPSTVPVEDISRLLEPIRAEHKLPALAGAIVRYDRVVGLGATGVRKIGDPTPVTPRDKFHIGSCTKSMTATVVAALVEKGKLKWSTTIAESFPELKGKINAAYRDVTVEELLTHRSGLPEDRTPEPWFVKLRLLTGPMTEQRLEVVELALKQPPAAERGERMIYSNLGYVVAGAMAEQASGRSWETLMQETLLGPLNMPNSGYGPPGTREKLDQPRGHNVVEGRQLAIDPIPIADNPVCFGPAGTVHCPPGEWARYAALHLGGARGEGKLLKPETFKKLHTPPAGEDYAMGWAVVEREGVGRVLAHSGSNGLWFATIAFSAERNVAVLVATNQGDAAAVSGCREAERALFGHALHSGSRD
jgi:CubicO group peptidase (beta-lactamase class C family)